MEGGAAFRTNPKALGSNRILLSWWATSFSITLFVHHFGSERFPLVCTSWSRESGWLRGNHCYHSPHALLGAFAPQELGMIWFTGANLSSTLGVGIVFYKNKSVCGGGGGGGSLKATGKLPGRKDTCRFIHGETSRQRWLGFTDGSLSRSFFCFSSILQVLEF